MTARPAITTSCFGDVDSAALERLESSYDTTRLLAAVDIVDCLRTQLHDPEGLRDDLLEIQGMAHAVLNGAPSWPMRQARRVTTTSSSNCWRRGPRPTGICLRTLPRPASVPLK